MVVAWLALGLAYPQAFPAETAFGVPNRFHDEVLQFRTLEAERVIVMENGGFWPTIALLQNGELAVIARTGAPHGVTRGGSQLALTRSGDGGRTWSEPVGVAASRPNQDLRDGWLSQLKDGTLVLGFHIYEFDAQGRADNQNVNVYLTQSKDLGRTWTVPSKIDISPHTWGNTHSRIVELPSGTLLIHVATAYSHNPGRADIFRSPGDREFQSHVFRSKDGGKTWGDRSLISNGDETGLLLLSSGKLLAAVRGEHGVSIHESVDEGRTWWNFGTATESGEKPGSLLQLKDGRVLFSYGDRRLPFYGVQAMISRDEGKTWDRQNRFQLVWDAPTTDCGYPTSVQLPDGRIFTVYYQVDDLKNSPATAKARAVVWTVPS